MPLEDLTRIDLISTSDDGSPVLIITDAGVTPDPDERFELLKKKLGLYMMAIEDENFRKDFPGWDIGDFQIRVTCANLPTEQMLAITAIAPKGEHDKKIRVEFDHAPLNGTGKTPIRRQPLEAPELSAELSKLLDFVFAMGLGALKDGAFAVQSAWSDGDGVSVGMPVEFEDAREAIKASRDVAVGLPNALVFAIAADGRIGTDDGGKRDALIVEAYERGQEKGHVYAQAYQPKAFFKKFKLIGERQYLALVDNILV